MARKLLTTLALAIMIASGAEGADMGSHASGMFSYQSLETGESLTIDLQRKTIINGDMTFDIEVCKPTSEYICIRSKAFDFAVPRDVKRLEPKAGQVTLIPGGQSTEQSRIPPASWVVDGQSYRLISPLGSQGILGKRVEVAVIQTSHFDDGKKWHVRYYYSPKLGLLGFLILSPATDYQTLFLLGSVKGFGTQDPETKAEK